MESTIIACSIFIGGLTFGGLLAVAGEIKKLATSKLSQERIDDLVSLVED
jgi:hypothetical protein